MSASPAFKIASEEWEFQAIHELNYRTFVEEIPQHAPRRDKCLVDRFHLENTYVICLVGLRLVGMLSLRSSRPFSLDHKLHNLDDYLPEARSIVEVRLLSIEPEYRKGRILVDLLHHAVDVADTAGHDLVIISGTTRQLKLYRHLGFVGFGPLVGGADALFQPMYLTRDALNQRACRLGHYAGR
jgi:GNAT superfamily N-acetyltransferase